MQSVPSSSSTNVVRYEANINNNNNNRDKKIFNTMHSAISLLSNLFEGDEAQFYKVHTVPGDGKCFYYSLSLCLTGDIRNADILKKLSERSRSAAQQQQQVITCSSSYADSTNVENIENKLNIKCIFFSKSRPFSKDERLPRVYTTPFGDALDPGLTSDMPERVTRYVFMAYDEECHFSPITYNGKGNFALQEIPRNLRNLLIQALPPFKALSQSSGCSLNS